MELNSIAGTGNGEIIQQDKVISSVESMEIPCSEFRDIDIRGTNNLQSKNISPREVVPARGLETREVSANNRIDLTKLSLPDLLKETNRPIQSTPGDGHNNCGFHAIGRQILGFKSGECYNIDAVREILGYEGEKSGTMFSTDNIVKVVDVFSQPVIVIDSSCNAMQSIEIAIPNCSAGAMIFALGEADDLNLNFESYLWSKLHVQKFDTKEEEDANNSNIRCKCDEILRIIGSLLKLDSDADSIAKLSTLEAIKALLKSPQTIVLIHTPDHFESATHTQ